MTGVGLVSAYDAVTCDQLLLIPGQLQAHKGAVSVVLLGGTSWRPRSVLGLKYVLM